MVHMEGECALASKEVLCYHNGGLKVFLEGK